MSTYKPLQAYDSKNRNWSQIRILQNASASKPKMECVMLGDHFLDLFSRFVISSWNVESLNPKNADDSNSSSSESRFV